MTDIETPVMITFGVLGGALFLGRYGFRGNRRAILTGASILSFGTTTFVGGMRLIKNPEYKTNPTRNITKSMGVVVLGGGLAILGLSKTLSTLDPTYDASDYMKYFGAFLVASGITTITVASDIANVVGWEGYGDDRLPWWSI